MSVIHIETAQQFEEAILKSDQVCVVDFFADWCMPCKMQAPIIEELADELDQTVIAKLDIDQIPVVARDYDVQSIPTILVFKDGDVVSQAVGVQSREDLEELIEDAQSEA